MPITWKNISAPDFSSGNALMKAGGESITGGLNSLAKAAKTYGTQQEDQRVAIRDDNTQTFLDQINQMKTMDGYTNQADQFSQSALSGQNVDASKIMAAYGQQEQDIQGLMTSRNTYKASQHAESERLLGIEEKPILDEFNRLQGIGDNEGAAAYQKEHAGEVRDWKAALAGLQNETRLDDAYDQGQTTRKQTTSAGEIYTNVLHDPNTNEGNIQSILKLKFEAEGIPLSVYGPLMSGARGAWTTGTSLTKAATGRIASIGSMADGELALLEQLTQKARDEIPHGLTNQEYASYTAEAADYRNPSDALRYIGDNSGESELLTPDDSDLGATGVQGAENGITAAQKIADQLVNDISKPGREDELLVLNTTEGRIPGFVLKWAFDSVGKDKDGEWEMDLFRTALKNEWQSYLRKRGAVNARNQVETDYNAKKFSLNSSKQTRMSEATANETSAQLNAFYNSTK
tara:strand:- start:539 stop:1921 length:1383 start_codon:yes stop_codon:yes gene_type:complete